MNSLDRIKSAIRFEKTDRIPVVPQVFGHAAVLNGEALGDYVRDGELLASCQLKALARYGYDAVFAIMDAGVETEAAGSRLVYRKDIYPFVEKYAIGHIGDLDKMAIPEPHRDGRMPELLRAAHILRRELCDEVMIVGCVLGPMTLAMQLMGPEKVLFLAADDPDAFRRLLDFATSVATAFGLAQIEAGVHAPFVFDPSASPAVVPPQFFREFLVPPLKRLFSELKSGGSAAGWLHIAGPVEAVLQYYCGTGADLVNIDYCVDPLRARSILPAVCLNGNVKPLSFVDAAAGDISAESGRLLEMLGSHGGFILSSGCEVPPEARPENVAAMVRAAREGK